MKESQGQRARPSVSSEALALEVKNALAHFEFSSSWLFGLAEHISGLPFEHRRLVNGLDLWHRLSHDAV